MLNIWAVLTDSSTGLSFLFAFVQNIEALVALKRQIISPENVKYMSWQACAVVPVVYPSWGRYARQEMGSLQHRCPGGTGCVTLWHAAWYLIF